MPITGSTPWRAADTRAVLAGGILAGLGDITQAFIVFGSRGVPPIRVLQSIAVGLAGRVAYDGGWYTAIAGLLLHFAIATIWAAIFVLASRTWRRLVDWPILCGLLYGLIVFLIMYEAVLPISRVARDPRASLFTMPLVITGWIGHPFLVGLPIALAARHFSRRPP